MVKAIINITKDLNCLQEWRKYLEGRRAAVGVAYPDKGGVNYIRHNCQNHKTRRKSTAGISAAARIKNPRSIFFVYRGIRKVGMAVNCNLTFFGIGPHGKGSLVKFTPS